MVKYPQRIPPHESLQLHHQVTGDASVAEGVTLSLGTLVMMIMIIIKICYFLFVQKSLSGGHQCILAAVLGDPISSLQVDEKLHSVIQCRKENALN